MVLVFEMQVLFLTFKSSAGGLGKLIMLLALKLELLFLMWKQWSYVACIGNEVVIVNF